MPLVGIPALADAPRALLTYAAAGVLVVALPWRMLATSERFLSAALALFVMTEWSYLPWSAALACLVALTLGVLAWAMRGGGGLSLMRYGCTFSYCL